VDTSKVTKKSSGGAARTPSPGAVNTGEKKKKENNKAATSGEGKVAVAGLYSFPATTAQYIQFTPTVLRSNGDFGRMIQVSEFEFHDAMGTGTGPISIRVITNPGGSNPPN